MVEVDSEVLLEEHGLVSYWTGTVDYRLGTSPGKDHHDAPVRTSRWKESPKGC